MSSCTALSGTPTTEEIAAYNNCVANDLILANPQSSNNEILLVDTTEFDTSFVLGTLYQKTQIISTTPQTDYFTDRIQINDLVAAQTNIYAVTTIGDNFTIEFDSSNYINIIQTHELPSQFDIDITGTGSLNTDGTYDQAGLITSKHYNIQVGQFTEVADGTSLYMGSVWLITDGKFNPISKSHGIMLAPGFTQDRTHTEFNNVRMQLRNAWNTQYKAQLKEANKKIAIGGFRAVNNAGDLLSRKNYACGGSNQLSKSKPGYKGLMGSIMNRCDETGVPAANCNPKYVYDSSDYIRYLKQKEHGRNYNDNPGGGTSTSSFVLGPRI
jgi:hypothetical protein